MSFSSRWGLVLVLLTACAGEPAPSRAVRASDKPSAPVSLNVEQTEQGSGRIEVRVVATPSENLRSAELRLILPAGVTAREGDKPIAFGPTQAGKPLKMVRHLQLDVPGADVVVDARVDAGAGVRNRAHMIRVGAAKPVEAPQPTNTVVLPNGDVVEEVRQ